jgi:hypothetical protein
MEFNIENKHGLPFLDRKTEFEYLGPEKEPQKWQKIIIIGNTENKFSGMAISQFLLVF